MARLLICAGGTGGGVYPALVVRQALDSNSGSGETPVGKNPTLWVGGEGGMEADLVQRAGIPFTTIPAGQIAGMGLRTLPNLFKVLKGALAARRILNDFKPDVLLFTGGYVAVPMALAGAGLLGGRKILTGVLGGQRQQAGKTGQQFQRHAGFDIGYVGQARNLASTHET